ncbi:MAG: hypothetical protein V3V19_10110 [Cocleimonas sp.]
MEKGQLQGLIIPLKDESFNPVLYLSLLVLVGFLSFIAWRWYKKKLKNQAVITAQKSLYALQQSYNSTSQTSQNTALELVSILCQGLGVKRLDQYQAYDPHKWHTFHQTLNTLCYSKQPLIHSSKQSSIEISSLFKEAKKWLSTK